MNDSFACKPDGLFGFFSYCYEWVQQQQESTTTTTTTVADLGDTRHAYALSIQLFSFFCSFWQKLCQIGAPIKFRIRH